MHGSDLLGGCIVKQLISLRDALIVAAAGPVLLHGNFLFNVTLAVLIQSLVTLSYLSSGSIAFDQNRTD
jgi:hypothetical protein